MDTYICFSLLRNLSQVVETSTSGFLHASSKQSIAVQGEL
jgi:hypothetical protein